MQHVEDGGVHFPGHWPHDGKRGHIQSNAGTLLQLGLVQLGAATHHVPRPRRRLDDETVRIQLLEHVADQLSHTLDRLEVLLRPDKIQLQLFAILPQLVHDRLCVLVILHLLLARINRRLSRFRRVCHSTK